MTAPGAFKSSCLQKGKLALPGEAPLSSGQNRLVQGLGKSTPIEGQGLSGALPKPFPIFIPLFYMDGTLVAFTTLDFFVLLIGIVLYLIISEKRKRDRARREWEAQVQAETRYYADQAAQARRITEELNRQARVPEQDIRNAIARFEAEDREEAERHEAAKRALGNGGDWR